MKNSLFKCAVGFACFFLSACASQMSNVSVSRQPTLRQSSISGRFVVTAVSGRSVVYRQVSGEGVRDARYVVVYRDGLQIPAVGTSFNRSPENGFKVVGVTSAVDGTATYNAIDLKGGVPPEGASSGIGNAHRNIPNQPGAAAGLNDF